MHQHQPTMRSLQPTSIHGNSEDGHEQIADGQIGNEYVGDLLAHGLAEEDHLDHDQIAEQGDENDESVHDDDAHIAPLEMIVTVLHGQADYLCFGQTMAIDGKRSISVVRQHVVEQWFVEIASHNQAVECSQSNVVG